MSAAHIDDELLSAHLDGDDLSAEAEAHLATCRVCHARLQALSEASDALGTPVYVPSAVREAAVATALAAGGDGALRGGGRAGGFPRWLAAAAAAVVVVVGIGVVTQLGGDDDNAATTAAGRNVPDGGDLGELDAASLRDQLQAAVEPEAAALGTQAEGGGEVADSDSPTGGGGSGGDDAGGPTMAQRSESKAARTGSTTACEQRVRRDYDKGLVGPLVYKASGTWQGRAAFVLTYRIDKPQGELDHLAYVVARDDCSLLNIQAF